MCQSIEQYRATKRLFVITQEVASPLFQAQSLI